MREQQAEWRSWIQLSQEPQLWHSQRENLGYTLKCTTHATARMRSLTNQPRRHRRSLSSQNTSTRCQREIWEAGQLFTLHKAQQLRSNHSRRRLWYQSHQRVGRWALTVSSSLCTKHQAFPKSKGRGRGQRWRHSPDNSIVDRLVSLQVKMITTTSTKNDTSIESSAELCMRSNQKKSWIPDCSWSLTSRRSLVSWRKRSNNTKMALMTRKRSASTHYGRKRNSNNWLTVVSSENS